MSPRAEPEYGSGQCRLFGDVRHRRDGRPGNPQPVDLSARKPLCWIAPFSRHKDMSKRLLTIYISHGALHGADLAFPCKPAVNVVLNAAPRRGRRLPRSRQQFTVATAYPLSSIRGSIRGISPRNEVTARVGITTPGHRHRFRRTPRRSLCDGSLRVP